MIAKLLTIIPLIAMLLFQDPQLQRQVMRKHQNGKPYVVLYFKSTTQELVKEEVFFANGNPQWMGSYKNDLEDGTWKYFYENGRLKSEQHYTKGKEDGTFTDYDESGKMVKQGIYSSGKLVKEVTF